MGLVRDKRGVKRNLLSILVTFAIIFGLVIAGPVSAVKLQLKTNKAVYNKNDDTVTILASVDIERNELVPIKNLTIRINDNFKVCTFDTDGTVHNCPNISVTLLNPGIIDLGDLNGEGFGFMNPGDTPGNEETEFGFGYGVDQENKKTGLKGELLYEIKWKISKTETPNGKYEAELEAFALDNGVQYTYLTKRSKKFNIKLNKDDKPNVKHTADVKGEHVSINQIGDDTDFSREDGTFSTHLTYLSNGHQIIGGRTALNAYAEQDDGSKIQFQVEMTDHHPVNFEIDDIEVTGSALVKYQKNVPGMPGVRIREMVDDVKIKIEDGMVTMSTDDPDMPFELVFVVNRYEFS